MSSYTTWCFLTKFVCRYDQLDEAKQRHQQCVDGLRDRYHVHFSSEQALNFGHSEPLFTLLLVEITGNDVKLPPQEEDEYSLFCFVTVIDVPDSEDNGEWYAIAELLQIDFEEGFPGIFPSRTRGIMVSPGGHELEGCIYQ